MRVSATAAAQRARTRTEDGASSLRYVTLRNRGGPTRRTRSCAASRTSTPLKSVPLVAAAAATFARRRRARTIRSDSIESPSPHRFFLLFTPRSTMRSRPAIFPRSTSAVFRPFFISRPFPNRRDSDELTDENEARALRVCGVGVRAICAHHRRKRRAENQ